MAMAHEDTYAVAVGASFYGAGDDIVEGTEVPVYTSWVAT